MEYLERLSKAIESLEDSSDKLSKVPELLTATKGLTEEVIKEKNAITYSQKELLGLKSRIEKQTDEVEKLAEALESITTNLTDKVDATEKNLQETMSKDKKEIIDSINNLSEKVEECHRCINASREETKKVGILVILSIITGLISILIAIF